MKKNKIAIFVSILFLSFFLRFWNLSINPPGLYWDEAAFGYNAYSILKTGHDEHGRFIPLFFESFGDWKLPGYFYLLVPSIKLFGLMPFSVRFPSAFLGALTPVIFFFLVRKITGNSNLSLTSMLFLAISPWHIQFSRAGFETTAGLFFIVLGVYLFLKAKELENPFILFASLVLFIASTYTYQAYRIFTPLLVLSLFLIDFEFLKKRIKLLIIPVVLALILTIPLLIFTFSQNGRTRAVSQSAFRQEDVDTARLAFDQKSKKPLRFLSKYLFPNAAYYSQVALKGYLDHFSPKFLFVQGDSVGRHSQVDMGQIYIFDALFISLAFFAFKKIQSGSKQSFSTNKKIFLVWLFLAPLPAMIVMPTPHADRTFQMVIPLTFLSAQGAYFAFSSKKLFLLKVALVIFVAFSFATYIHLLFIHYPKKFSADWQDGYQKMVGQIQKYQGNFDKIYITNASQQPYIYLLFYQKYDPAKYMASGTQDHFDKYVFIPSNYDVYNKGKILYVAPSWQRVDGKLLSVVTDTSENQVFLLWEIGGQD